VPFWHPSLRRLLHRAQDFVALVAASGAAEAAVYEPDPIWYSEAVAKDSGVGDDCPFDCAGGILSFFVVAVTITFIICVKLISINGTRVIDINLLDSSAMSSRVNSQMSPRPQLRLLLYTA
jgi:hypothetical protein